MSTDYDKLSDEEFEDMLDNIDDVDDTVEDTDQDDVESNEPETETDTKDDDDDQDWDTEEDDGEDEEDGSEENAHDLAEDDNESTEEDESDETGSEDEDDSEEETEDQPSPENMTDKNKIDYQKAYEDALVDKARLEEFFRESTQDFVANGKKMSAPKDPKKITQAFQKAAGFDEKMKSFKKYRPFITPLQEKGIIDNPDKFNLMMNALDGDQEAIKKMISDAEIDPIELDMDNINYQPKNAVASNIELAYGDVMESASQNGVRDQVQKVVSGDWDDDSVLELLDDPQNSADLVNHLSTGIYDLVQERIAQKTMSDPHSIYSSKKSIEQYREAAQELEQEYKMFLDQQQVADQGQPEQNMQVQDNGYGNQEYQFSEDEIQEEIERIKQERTYEAKVNKKNAQAAEGRKRAASLSKKKPRSKKRNTTFDPGKLSDDEFTAYLDSMIFDD